MSRGDRRSTGPRRRLVGRIMMVVAAVGLVVSLVGTVVAWQLVGQLNSSTRETLDVTIETMDSVEATIDVADQVLDATTDTIESVSATLNTVASSFETATDVIVEVDDLTTTVGPALDDAGSALRTLEGLGSRIDNVLRDLSQIPFGPDYDPDQELGETIGEIASTLEGLPAQFSQTSTDLDAFTTTLDDLASDVVTLAADIETVSAELSGSTELIDLYRQNIADARVVAIETRDGLDRDVSLMRLVLLIGGLNFAIGQIVPYWIGRGLLEKTATEPDAGPEANPETGDTLG
ncbi:hypothetical protein [Ilumatobacter sp.]|uniref:hypothetical protein n=1 Tax=Ilumatobacter sp. TaxID=1967498 RepID=UPI003C53C443